MASAQQPAYVYGAPQQPPVAYAVPYPYVVERDGGGGGGGAGTAFAAGVGGAVAGVAAGALLESALHRDDRSNGANFAGDTSGFGNASAVTYEFSGDDGGGDDGGDDFSGDF